LALISNNNEIIDKVEDQYGKNTTEELAFEILDYTKMYYEERNKDSSCLDYQKYKDELIA
ncbi:MAG: hypothetical protein II223_07870, partial [Treponema sp.]|nr:hypothetical protein [Treponema sp.]